MTRKVERNFIMNLFPNLRFTVLYDKPEKAFQDKAFTGRHTNFKQSYSTTIENLRRFDKEVNNMS